MADIINISNMNILIGKNKDVFDFIVDYFKKNKTWIITINSLMYIEYLKNLDYQKCFNKASFSIPDGVGIVNKLNKKNLNTERITGIDTLEKLFELSSKNNYNVYLLGSKLKYVKSAAEKTNLKYKDIIKGYRDGYFNEKEEQKIVEDINKLNIDILFVGMGIPNQELFLLRNYDNLNIRLAMGVGGSFDVISDHIPRAPNFFQKLGLEWFYRIIKEPKRLNKIPDLIKFYFKKI